MTPHPRSRSPWPVRATLLALLAVLSHCDAAGCRPSGGEIPQGKFEFHRVPDAASRQVACVDITFYHFSAPPISWHCPTEVGLGADLDPAAAQSLAARATDEAAGVVMSLGRPESADAACGAFYARLKAALSTQRPEAAVGVFDACTRHRLPIKTFP